jgi:DNA excision repair protein ERCC-5
MTCYIFFIKLDYTNQTNGTITEDSDVWLFGARNVYKNFFSSDQFIDFYSDQVIKSQIGKAFSVVLLTTENELKSCFLKGFDRESFINIALLVGSDYTEGNNCGKFPNVSPYIISI